MSIDEETRIRRLLRVMGIVAVSGSIAEKAGFLARTRPKNKVDLLIAATAIELGVPITKNVKDFARIPDLEVRTEI